jgi:hypothetical protein
LVCLYSFPKFNFSEFLTSFKEVPSIGGKTAGASSGFGEDSDLLY